MMQIFPVHPVSRKPTKIICVGCGKRAIEAGIAVPDKCAELGYGPDGPYKIVMVDDGEIQSLCEGCLAVLVKNGGPRRIS